MVLNEFLGLCGFNDVEIEEHIPRVQRAFAKVGLDDTDVRQAIVRINRYYDVSLQGVRKLIGVTILSFLELVLAREEGHRKIVYSEWPLTVPIMMAIRRADPEILVTTPAMICNVVLGQFFGKLIPITEAGEELGQPAGQAHCPLYQTHVGAIAKGIAPKPDLEIACGLLCEPPPAAMAILEELYGIPYIVVDGCVDSPWGDWPTPYLRQVDYGAKEIYRCFEEVEKFTECKVTPEVMDTVFSECVYPAMLLQKVFTLMARSDPQPISQVDAGVGMWQIATPVSPQLMQMQVDALETLLQETQERVDKGIGILPKGSPRVYAAIAVAADPSIMKLFEESGLSVPVNFIGWQAPGTRLKMPYSTSIEKTAAFIQRAGIACSTYGAIEYPLMLQRELNLDGAILCFATSCRLYSMTPLMVKKALQKEFPDFPVMVLEGEFYDIRNYSAEQMRTRVETFAHMLKEHKAGDVV